MTKEKLSVLYVDDDPTNLMLFHSILEDDVDLTTSRSAIEGLKILEKQVFQVIITDQEIGDMKGLEFLKEVYNISPETPPYRILSSEKNESNEMQESFKNGHYHKFIRKPWDKQQIKTMFEELIF